jgi:hypothetical protein
MSNLTVSEGNEALRYSLLSMVKENARDLAVDVDDIYHGEAFTSLMKRAAEKYNSPVVVLIDEYDSPMLRFINQPERSQEIREIMRDFYVRIKAADAHLRFVFITGISKFSKMGVFSALNNLIDISMNDKYAQMLGYTGDELLSNFDAYIDMTANQLEMQRETLIAKIREYYDGFSFDGKTRLYNPFSTLYFFKNPTFRNYWFESGTPSALVEYIKKHDLEVESFRGMKVSEDFASVSEIEHASPESFLYQCGYLSVRERDGNELILDYPNMEVLSSISKLFLYGKFELPIFSNVTLLDMEKAAARGDAEGIVNIYSTLLASLPYEVYKNSETQHNFYQSLLFASLWSSKINTTAENHSHLGRSDIEAEKNGHNYVIEMKVADGKEALEKAADEAMKQILEKGYADKYAISGATLIAIAIDRDNRCVGASKIAKYGSRHLGE